MYSWDKFSVSVRSVILAFIQLITTKKFTFSLFIAILSLHTQAQVNIMDLSSPFAALLAKFNRYDGVLNAAANESEPRDTGIEILGIDPRAHTKEKLAAPAPLPHLSRGSLRRVKHRLPAPTTCPYCKEDTVELVRNSEIYSRGSAGSWPFAYLCRPCRAYVGVHPHTDLPLGTLADEATREARKEGKSWFQRLVRREQGERGVVYQWLAEQMNIRPEQCHWAMFDEALANEALEFCKLKVISGETVRKPRRRIRG